MPGKNKHSDEDTGSVSDNESENDSVEAPKKRKRTTKKTKKSTVAKAKSAYAFFSKDWNSKNTGVEFKERTKLVSAAWGALSEDDKKPFQALADADKARYAEEKANEPEPEDSDEDGPPKKKRKVAPKDPNAPKKALSAYMLFNADQRKNGKFSFAQLSEKWNALDADAKKPYEAAALVEKAKYDEAMKAYKSGKTTAAEEDEE